MPLAQYWATVAIVLIWAGLAKYFEYALHTKDFHYFSQLPASLGIPLLSSALYMAWVASLPQCGVPCVFEHESSK